MKNSIKTLSVLLALLAGLALPLASCGKKQPQKNPGDSDTQDGTGETVSENLGTDEWGQDIIESTIPDTLNFGGNEEVKFLVIDSDNFNREYYAEEITDSLSREVYNRNASIEKQLGVMLSFSKAIANMGDQYASYNLKITNAGNSGLGEFDVISNTAGYGTVPALISFYLNFYDPQLKYFDFEKPWWNQYYQQAAEVMGKTYFMVSDTNLSVFDRIIAIYFNHNLCRSYDIEPEDLYQLVFDKKWTYERLYELCSEIYEDRNNDGLKDDQDFLGLIGLYESESHEGFLYSFDLHLIETNEDGMHYVVNDTGELAKLDSAMTMVQNLFQTKGALTTKGTENNMRIFVEKRAVFNMDVLYHYAETNALLRNLDDVYGVLPLPMYDENQADYYSGVQDMHNVMSLMNHGYMNYEAVSAVLELMAQKSYENVRPYYYEKIVKLRYTSDSTSAKVFDILLGSTRWDFADVYSRTIGGPRYILWRGVFQQNKSFMTIYQQNVEALDKKLTDFDMNVLTSLG